MNLDWSKYGIKEHGERGDGSQHTLRFRNEDGMSRFIVDNLRALSGYTVHGYTVQWNVDFEPILTIKPRK